jgi:hypothetical protein
MAGLLVDLVVTGELEAPEVAPEIGERLAVSGRGRNDPPDEDRVGSPDHLLDDVALDVGEGVTEQRKPELTGMDGDAAELVVAGHRELARQLPLRRAEHIHHVLAGPGHRRSRGHGVVDAREHQRRVGRQ